MHYTTLLTHQPENTWRAVVPGLPDCVAEAPTRAEVLEKIRERILETAARTEVLRVEVPARPRNANGDLPEAAASAPWHWFGAFQGDEQWTEIFTEIEQQRDINQMGG